MYLRYIQDCEHNRGENMTKNIADVKIRQVVKTTEEWSQVDQIIDKGILCVEVRPNGDTMIKIGDGVKTYSQLDYIKSDISHYSVPPATETALGGVIVGEGLSVVTDESASKGKISVNEMTAPIAPDPEDPSDPGVDGKAGIVPAPTVADIDKFLKSDGTWDGSVLTSNDYITLNCTL